jgi:hypothetical protein
VVRSTPNGEFDAVSEPVTATPASRRAATGTAVVRRAGDPLADRDGLPGHDVGPAEDGGDGERRPSAAIDAALRRLPAGSARK